jgi:hypothetical protein
MLCSLFFVLGLGTLVIVLIIVVLIKNVSKQGSPSDGLPQVRDGPRRHDVRVQHAADGFWPHAPRVRPGHLIHYRYWAGGTMRTGSVVVSHGPRGAFVYTGDVPSQIEVFDVLPPGQTVPADNDYGIDAGGTVASPSPPPQDAPEGPPAGVTPEPLTSPPLVDTPEPLTGPPPAY